ncbi:hypothetical protein ABPG74_007977 [Tetrahymena malaccensis]
MITLQTIIIFQIILIVQAQSQCPQNSYFSAQYQSCVCNDNYFFNSFSSTCEKCLMNSTSSVPQIFNESILSCDICLPNFYYNELQRQTYILNNYVPICIECPQGAGTSQENVNKSYQISSCNICLQNYYMSNPASESPTLNSAQCLPCPNGTVSSGALKVDQSVCDSCAVNYYMVVVSVSQVNDIMGEAAQCLACPNGSGTLESYNVASNLFQCSMCLENYYMVNPATLADKPSAAQCLPCPNNSYNPKNSKQGFCTCFDQNAIPLSQSLSQCNCKNGYYGSVATSFTSPSGCFPCPFGYYSSSQTFFKCLKCPSKFVTNQDQSDCICDVTGIGVILDHFANICICKNGYQEDISSPSGCSPCLFGWYSNSKTQNKCQICPSKFVINQDQSDCSCNFTGLGAIQDFQNNICMCKNGYYENKTSIYGCTPCPQGYYSNNSTSYKCISCPSGSHTNNDQSNCICNDQSIAVQFDPVNVTCKCQKDYFGNPSQATLNTIGSCTPCPILQLKVAQFQFELMKSQCQFTKFSNLIYFNLVVAVILQFILL